MWIVLNTVGWTLLFCLIVSQEVCKHQSTAIHNPQHAVLGHAPPIDRLTERNRIERILRLQCSVNEDTDTGRFTVRRHGRLRFHDIFIRTYYELISYLTIGCTDSQSIDRVFGDCFILFPIIVRNPARNKGAKMTPAPCGRSRQNQGQS